MSRRQSTLVIAVALAAAFLAFPASGQSAPKPSDKDLADITARGVLLAEV